MTRSFILLLGLAGLAAAADGPVVDNLHVDFRGKPIDETLFEKVGAIDQIRIEPEGLRITLPAGDRAPETGLQSKFRVKGDFEITMSYELLSVGTPKQANVAAGASLYLRTEAEEALTLGRFKRTRGDSYSYYRAAPNGTTGGQMIATGVVAGRLRVVRHGSVAAFQVAAAENAEKFVEAHHVPFGTEDVVLLRVVAGNGNSDALVDVRIHDLEIRSTAPTLPVSAAPEPATSRNRPVAMVIAGLAALMLLLALWRRWWTRDAGVAIGQPEVQP